jgi:NADP-dependent 3-hydroxy acid dehydrogenase YdfG
MADTSQKAIFITGGGSGIGQATAKLFAARGWRVGLADVNAAGLTATSAMLPPGTATTYVMDVRDRDAWVASLDAFTAVSGGRLDVLFNNAGIATGGPLTDTSFDDIDRTIAINLMGVLNGARIGFAYLARTHGSCLLNTASASAIYGCSGLYRHAAAGGTGRRIEPVDPRDGDGGRARADQCRGGRRSRLGRGAW